jgi:hypothetical protein
MNENGAGDPGVCFRQRQSPKSGKGGKRKQEERGWNEVRNSFSPCFPEVAPRAFLWYAPLARCTAAGQCRTLAALCEGNIQYDFIGLQVKTIFDRVKIIAITLLLVLHSCYSHLLRALRAR